MDGNSSLVSPFLCHFGHTSTALFAFNFATHWTLGHYHISKCGMTGIAGVMALSCATATLLGIYQVRKNTDQVIAGGMASSAGLITYNCFKNP